MRLQEADPWQNSEENSTQRARYGHLSTYAPDERRDVRADRFRPLWRHLLRVIAVLSRRDFGLLCRVGGKDILTYGLVALCLALGVEAHLRAGVPLWPLATN